MLCVEVGHKFTFGQSVAPLQTCTGEKLIRQTRWIQSYGFRWVELHIGLINVRWSINIGQ